ncbi:hypothetical protein L249_8839 [Ophiocordyceps polyrhachis-furcata BCC 54312]|uniref:SPX domain-containing protein n=1 Tax=Ophiocordyceps polyrhachis-furcata BCC 54312 TaxID=1330021 RepID=A0A367L1R3_9HYPO|nr:hypothetical protein L249_8839 [Ophiocordyceps polyrhachis-furcata BCC 54312]
MKYGQQLEHESVPEWRLHNLDYNSLKHEIKAHTSSLQATPTAIPGHPCKFEDGLYFELDRQHSRLDLFVTSKADEISRRLDHLDADVHRWLRKHADDASPRGQRRLVKYERDLLRCGRDILALSRFANAQVVAFRKILKKYRKWTGSVSLTWRFNQNVLGNPKSFTKRDFEPLQARYDDMLADIRSASVAFFSEPSSPSTDSRSTRKPKVTFDATPPPRFQPQVYWNEYDDGSEAAADDYAIYVNPDDRVAFPGLACVRALTAVPYGKAKQWLDQRRKHTDDSRPLLGTCADRAGGRRYYSSIRREDEVQGYDGIGVEEDAGRDRVLARGTAGCLVASFVLLGLAATLMAAGRSRMRVEVDAGVTAGVLFSLVCACAGLGMALCRRRAPGMLHRVVIWAAFVSSCLCSGVLLVFVLASAP